MQGKLPNSHSKRGCQTYFAVTSWRLWCLIPSGTFVSKLAPLLCAYCFPFTTQRCLLCGMQVGSVCAPDHQSCPYPSLSQVLPTKENYELEDRAHAGEAGCQKGEGLRVDGTAAGRIHPSSLTSHHKSGLKRVPGSCKDLRAWRIAAARAAVQYSVDLAIF